MSPCGPAHCYAVHGHMKATSVLLAKFGFGKYRVFFFFVFPFMLTFSNLLWLFEETIKEDTFFSSTQDLATKTEHVLGPKVPINL